MANVLAVVEQRSGVLKQVSREVLTAARNLADETNGSVEALLIGPEPLDPTELGVFGADRVCLVEDDALFFYQPDPYRDAVAQRAQSGGQEVVLMAATAMGKDLGPRVAARLGCPLAADVTSIEVDGGCRPTTCTASRTTTSATAS